jgi:hypothetical protein
LRVALVILLVRLQVARLPRLLIGLLIQRLLLLAGAGGLARLIPLLPGALLIQPLLRQR